jgi:hypothetical protein
MLRIVHAAAAQIQHTIVSVRHASLVVAGLQMPLPCMMPNVVW